MADVKISGLPTDSSLDGNHYVPINDPSGPTTKRTLLSTLAAFFFNQVNIPSGSGSPITRDDETSTDFVQTGLVWSGDAYASTRVASMTAGTVYINGRRILISAVVSRTFTASKDTYVDILDNADGTGTLVYTEATNNATAPALAANSIRIAIIITGASNIANVGSINQGEPGKLLPIASSTPYEVTDNLGNLICNRNPQPTRLGYRSSITSFDTTATVVTNITGMSTPILASGTRDVEVYFNARAFLTSAAGNQNFFVHIREGSTTLKTVLVTTTAANLRFSATPIWIGRPTAGLHTYVASVECGSAGTHSVDAAATYPMFIVAKQL